MGQGRDVSTGARTDSRSLIDVTIGDWIALAGVIATVGLIVVAWLTLHKQLATANRQAMIGHLSDYTQRYQAITLKFPESINEPTFDLANHEARDDTMRYMRAYIDLCYEEWWLARNDFLDSLLWQVWDGGIATAMGKRAFSDAWRIIQRDSKYDDEFRDYLDSLALPTSSA
jgi:hypothetical protein